MESRGYKDVRQPAVVNAPAMMSGADPRFERRENGVGRANSQFAGGMTELGKSGAQGRNRTADTVIFSHVLYQLSYLGSRDGADRPSKRRAPYLSLSSLSTPAASAAGPAIR